MIMKKYLITLLLVIFTLSLIAQTSDIGGGDWSDPNTWVEGNAPPYTNIREDIIIDSYIISNQTIEFAGGGNTRNDLTINDTLVIYGNLSMGLDDNITINTGGVLIVVGDFTAFNQVDLALGGVLVVTGEFNKSGGDGDITDDGGDIYLFDDDPEWGNDSPDVDYGDEDDIINDPIIDVIGDIINSGCSLSLSLDSIVDVSTIGGNDGAIYITVTGTVDSYSWATNDGSGLVATDEDQTGLTAGTYSVAVTGSDDGATCSVFGSYIVSEVLCSEPTITGTTPGSRCGTGTVTLGAMASAGTINWYDVETGGTSLETGTSFTTPSITSTTTYWVDATDAGCTTESRTAVTAAVNPLPTATITVDNDSICSGTKPIITIDFTTPATHLDLTINDGTNPEENINVFAEDEPYDYIPNVAPLWEDNGNPVKEYTYNIQITDSNGCVNRISSPVIYVFKNPETGPQYHISNDWNQ